MPIIPCPNRVRCKPTIVLPGIVGVAEGDSPVINFSSEATDSVEFIGINRGWNDNDPPLDSEWQSSWCQGICFSKISQEDADLCAARAQMACSIDPGNGGGPGRGGDDGGDSGNGPWVPPLPPNFPPGGEPPHYDLFENTPQSSSYSCPDGTTFLFTTPAGTFVAMTQTKADSMAKSYADSKVKEAAICLLAIESKACLGIVYGSQINLEGAFPPFSFALVAGALPPGLKLTQLTARTGLISGTPTAGGNYTFTIRVVDSHGSFMQKTYTISVLAISNPTALPDAVLGAAYSEQLNPVGGFGPWVFSVLTGSLPDGLTLSSSGLISGTPTLNGPFDFRVQVQDATGNACQFDFSIDAVGGCPDFVSSLAIPGVLPSCTPIAADTTNVIFPRVLLVDSDLNVRFFDRDTDAPIATIPPALGGAPAQGVYAPIQMIAYISVPVPGYVATFDVNGFAEIGDLDDGAGNPYLNPVYDAVNNLVYFTHLEVDGLTIDLVTIDPTTNTIVSAVPIIAGDGINTLVAVTSLGYSAAHNELYFNAEITALPGFTVTNEYRVIDASTHAPIATVPMGDIQMLTLSYSTVDDVLVGHAIDLVAFTYSIIFIDGTTRAITSSLPTAISAAQFQNKSSYDPTRNLVAISGNTGPGVSAVAFVSTATSSVSCTRAIVGNGLCSSVDPAGMTYVGTQVAKEVRRYN